MIDSFSTTLYIKKAPVQMIGKEVGVEIC